MMDIRCASEGTYQLWWQMLRQEAVGATKNKLVHLPGWRVT